MGTFADIAKNYSPLTQNNPFGEDVQTDYDVTVEGPEGLFGSQEPTQNTLTLIDGDTFVGVDGSRYRLAGAYAPETAKVIGKKEGLLDDTPRVTEISAGQAFGQETMQAVNAVMQAGGFNRVVETGDESHGRKVAQITNDKGESLTEALYRAGILKPTAQTAKDMVDIYTNGQAARQLGYDTGYSDIAEKLDDVMGQLTIHKKHVDPETGQVLGGVQMFSGASLNEHGLEQDAQFASFHNQFKDIMFDDPNRTIDNRAKNSIGASMYTGWLGMKQGAYGALEMLGTTMGVDAAQEMGEIGIERTQTQMSQLPGIENLHFDDVNGIWDGMQFIGNNIAMSAPYLGLIGSGALLAPVAGGGLLGAAVSIAPCCNSLLWSDLE